MAVLSLSLLGPFAASLDGRALTKFRTNKVQALLIYLAVERELAHRREFLMTLLWPGLPQESAQVNLRQTIYRLNQAIPEVAARTGNGTVPLLLSDRQTVQIHPDGVYKLDVATFTNLLKGELTPKELKQATALYRGDFLADFYLPDSNTFEEWAAAWRAALRRQALEALADLATQATNQGDYAGAAAYARRQLAIDNLRESAYRQLMVALAYSGQRSEALAYYESCRRLLRDELGVEPSPPTRALYERLARGEVSEVVAAPAEPGTNRRIRSIERPRHNLPLQLSSFIGRERELAEVRRLLSTARLVTLVGAGGSGKTRLALQAAAGVLDTFADGVWFVELAPLSDAALVPQTVAMVLDIREVEDRPLLTLLLNYLRNRQLLLLLDNCEHVVEATAQMAETLLRHCPQLQILATSREVLNISGEAAWTVPPLSLPEAGRQTPIDTLRQADAIRLFAERAMAVLPTFVLAEENAVVVEQVCRRLDGMPLAIELAAARVKILRVEQIATRLDDRLQLLTGGSRTALPRHQTLRALIDWSYDLLMPAEQRVLRKLSVFAGGFTLEAVEAVCVGDDGGDAVELLTQLVNKSLVVAEREPRKEARYHLLESVRQYALEKLAEGGEARAVRTRHLNFFMRLAEEAEPRLFGAEEVLYLNRLEAEHDNLRAALTWSLEAQDEEMESGLRLAAALALFWQTHSHFREGERWLGAALAKRRSASLPLRARLLLNAGWLWILRRKDDSTALVQESLDLYRQLDDKRGVARGLCLLGHCVWAFKGDTVTASSLWEESLTLAGEVDDKAIMIFTYFGLAEVALAKGEGARAAEFSARGLALAQKTGAQWMRILMLGILEVNARQQRDYARATALLHEMLALARGLKDRTSEALALNKLGETARLQREYVQAAAFYYDSLALFREVDLRRFVVIVLHNLGLVALGQRDRRQATSFFRESMVLAQTEVKSTTYILWNMWGLARAALAEGQTRRATQLFAAAGPLENFGEAIMPVDRDDTEREVALARAQLGEEVFAAAWAAGQAMSLEEAIACALEV